MVYNVLLNIRMTVIWSDGRMRNEARGNSFQRRLVMTAVLVLLAGLILLVLVIAGRRSRYAEVPGLISEEERIAALPEEPEITGATWPTALQNGQFFGLRGNISCRYPLTEVRGTVIRAGTGEILFDAHASPNSNFYSIGQPTSEVINETLAFDSPRCSNSYLIYQLTVQYQKDGEILTALLIDEPFTVGTPPGDPPAAQSDEKPA